MPRHRKPIIDRRKYEPALRERLKRELLAGADVRALSKKHGIPKQTLWTWLSKARKATGSGPNGHVTAAELLTADATQRSARKDQRERLRDLEMENAVLKANIAYAKHKGFKFLDVGNLFGKRR